MPQLENGTIPCTESLPIRNRWRITLCKTDATESETHMEDSPAVAKRREREKKTISQMIALHCAHNHKSEARDHNAYCGEPVCEACAELDAYAVLRTQRCRKMDVKTSCEQCGNHCYRADMRERIRAAMRYSGPRMLTHHPVAAIRHLLGR